MKTILGNRWALIFVACLGLTFSCEGNGPNGAATVQDVANQQKVIDRQNATYDRQLKIADRQIEVVDRQLAKTDQQLELAEEHARRLDAILTKWEAQAVRFDAVLDRLEGLLLPAKGD